LRYCRLRSKCRSLTKLNVSFPINPRSQPAGERLCVPTRSRRGNCDWATSECFMKFESCPRLLCILRPWARRLIMCCG
jgi:hypothetical protein